MNTVVATPYGKPPTPKHVWQVRKAVGRGILMVASIPEDADAPPEDMFSAFIRHTNNEYRVNAERTYYYAKMIAWPLAQLAVEQAGEDGIVLWLHDNILPFGVAPMLLQTLKRRTDLAWVSAAPRMGQDVDTNPIVIDNPSRCVAWRASELLQWTEDFDRTELVGRTTMDAVMARMDALGQSDRYLWMNDLTLNG